MNENIYDQIIIGAGPAGLSAGIFSGQLMLKTLIIDEKSLGGQMKNATEVLNYPGILKTDGRSLSDVMVKQGKRVGVKFLQGQVKNVDFRSRLKKVTTGTKEYEAVSVILATGVKHRALGFDGEDKYKGNGVYYNNVYNCANYNMKDVFVVGADILAIEQAFFLTKQAKSVTILTPESGFTCTKELAERVMANAKINVRFSTEIKSLEGGYIPEKMVFTNNATGARSEYNAKEPFGIFIFSGYTPQTQFFDGKININQSGYVLVNKNYETSVPGVFAAGDIIEKEVRHMVTAISDGAIASTNAEKYIKKTKEELAIVIEPEEDLPDDTDDIPEEETIHTSRALKFQVINEEENTVEKFIDDKMASEIKLVFDKLKKQTHIVLVRENLHRFSMEMETILNELESLSEKIKVSIYKKDENERLEKVLNTDVYPVIGFFDEEDNFTGIKYHAVPSGHEFNSFLLAILSIGAQPVEIPSGVLDKINMVFEPVKIQVGILLSCDICPEVVQIAQLIAMRNKNIQVEFIDISNFTDFKNKYNILSVPAIVINEKEVVFGKKTLDEFIDLLYEAN